MKKQQYTIGAQVEKFCPTCDEQIDHIVKSVTKTGSVSRVNCSKCGLVSAFKLTANSAKIQNLATKTGAPYDQSRTYRTGQIMVHPTFGTGEVTMVFNTRMIDVMFMDRVRRLIHSRT